MLSPDFRYLTFDFETTGLDTKKDEPIQIGIVEFDYEFNILQTYTSLIKPKKNIKELRSIVQHITGFDLQQLENAPSMDEVVPEIQDYFTPNTEKGTTQYCVIGHNISFDLTILNNYLPFSPTHVIDTFQRAKSLLHFLPSYALDLINEYLKESNNHRSGELDNAHDALHDCYLGYNLFQKLITKIHHLRRNHILLDYTIQNSNGILHDIIQRTEKPFNFSEKKLFLPPLQTKVIPGEKKVINDHTKDITQSQYPNHSTLDASKTNVHTLINTINRGRQHRILATSHPAKMTLIENEFKRLSISTTTLHDQTIFDPVRVDTFLHKQNFDDSETLFIAKYLSQYDKGHTVLDINQYDDYKIFGALTIKRNTKAEKVTLCTHSQLFQMSHNISTEHTLLFWDKNNRAQAYQRHLHQYFDPLYILNELDQLLYKYNILQIDTHGHLEEFYKKTLFLHAILNIELNPFFTGHSQSHVEFNNISSNTRFPKTYALLSSWKDELGKLEQNNIFMLEDKECITKLKKLHTYLHTPTKVSKRMYNGNQRYYQFQASDVYVNRNEFIHALPHTKKTLFVSNIAPKQQNEKRIPLYTTPEAQNIITPGITTLTKPHKIINYLESKQHTIFIASSSKHQSKVLYDQLITSKLNLIYEILAENITGGVGKNLYRAGISTKPCVLIGGYNYYLSACAKNIHIQELILYHLHGPRARNIVQDMIWWSKQLP